MEDRLTYFNYAEADRDALQKIYQAGMKENFMAGLAQNICERYMKHLIEKYVGPENREDLLEKQDIMHTHSLNRLMRYLITQLPEFQLAGNEKMLIRSVDGFYFSTRYPGNDSFLAREEEIDLCMQAVELVRLRTISCMQECAKKKYGNTGNGQDSEKPSPSKCEMFDRAEGKSDKEERT